MMSLNRREVLKLSAAGAVLVAATTLGGCATGPSPTNAESPTPAAAAPVDPTKVPTKEPTGVPTAAATATNPAPEAKATRPVMVDHNVDRLAVGAEGVPSRALTAEQLGQTTEFGEGRTLAALGTGEGSARLFAGGASARILDAPKTMTFGGQTYALSGREGNGDLVKYIGSDGKTYVMVTGIDSEAYAMSAVLYSVGGDGPMVQPWDGNGEAVQPLSAGWRELKPGEKIVVDQLGNMSIVSADGKVSLVFETLERKWEQAAPAQVATAPVPPTSAPTPLPTKASEAAPKVPTVAPTVTLVPTKVVSSLGGDKVQGQAKMENSGLTENVTVVLGVEPNGQDLPLSCESAVAGMITKFFLSGPPAGFSDWEAWFVKNIPKSSNPDLGFVGDINGFQSAWNSPSYGYGVHADPVAKVMRSLGLKVEVAFGTSEIDRQQLVKDLGDGKLVGVWVVNPIYYKPYTEGMKRSFVDDGGRPYYLVEGEHILVVDGYRVVNGGLEFHTIDPWQGVVRWVKDFNRWDVFGGMRVVASKGS